MRMIIRRKSTTVQSLELIFNLMMCVVVLIVFRQDESSMKLKLHSFLSSMTSRCKKHCSLKILKKTIQSKNLLMLKFKQAKMQKGGSIRSQKCHCFKNKESQLYWQNNRKYNKICSKI